ncbi:MAG: sensor histidine kinase [Hansschlegelia sp.]
MDSDALLAAALAITGGHDGSTQESEEVAALRHRFRNQLQTMTSLVSLCSQRVGAGEGRDVLVDLRARFEAINLQQSDELAGKALVAGDRLLGLVVERLSGLYDPDRRRKIRFASSPFFASPRQAAALAQIMTEMMIDLFRSGFPSGSGAEARISALTRTDGALHLSLSLAGSGPAFPPSATVALGLSIAESLVHALEGSFERRAENGLTIEATLPPDPETR